MIEAKGLTRRFGDNLAVDHIDLKMGPGEIFGFLGPNGAGKTTTVRLLSCLISPTSGEAYVCGLDIRKKEDARKIRMQVGLLTENTGFYDNLSVMKNLMFYADLYHVKRQKAEKNIEHYLKLFNLWDKRESIVGGFSKGMRQKLALTRCLVHDPGVVFLDEPTSGLDPESARIVRDHIITLREEGKAIFLCTHNLDEAERLCDIIAIINHRIIDVGDKHSLKNTAYAKKVVIKLESMNKGVMDALASVRCIKHYRSLGDRLILEVEDPETDNADVVQCIVGAGGRIQSVNELRHSLEDVYMKRIGEPIER